jgi:hypothetical protein
MMAADLVGSRWQQVDGPRADPPRRCLLRQAATQPRYRW